MKYQLLISVCFNFFLCNIVVPSESSKTCPYVLLSEQSKEQNTSQGTQSCVQIDFDLQGSEGLRKFVTILQKNLQSDMTEQGNALRQSDFFKRFKKNVEEKLRNDEDVMPIEFEDYFRKSLKIFHINETSSILRFVWNMTVVEHSEDFEANIKKELDLFDILVSKSIADCRRCVKNGTMKYSQQTKLYTIAENGLPLLDEMKSKLRVVFSLYLGLQREKVFHDEWTFIETLDFLYNKQQVPQALKLRERFPVGTSIDLLQLRADVLDDLNMQDRFSEWQQECSKMWNDFDAQCQTISSKSLKVVKQLAHRQAEAKRIQEQEELRKQSLRHKFQHWAVSAKGAAIQFVEQKKQEEAQKQALQANQKYAQLMFARQQIKDAEQDMKRQSIMIAKEAEQQMKRQREFNSVIAANQQHSQLVAQRHKESLATALCEKNEEQARQRLAQKYFSQLKQVWQARKTKKQEDIAMNVLSSNQEEIALPINSHTNNQHLQACSILPTPHRTNNFVLAFTSHLPLNKKLTSNTANTTDTSYVPPYNNDVKDNNVYTHASSVINQGTQEQCSTVLPDCDLSNQRESYLSSLSNSLGAGSQSVMQPMVRTNGRQKRIVHNPYLMTSNQKK